VETFAHDVHHRLADRVRTGVAMKYVPAGPVLERFRASSAFVRGIRGPIGSGKSTACVIDILRRAKRQPAGPDGIRRRRTAIIRNTYPELHTTTIKTWHQWAPSGYGEWQKHGPPTHRLRHGDIEHEVLFLALDSPDDIGKLLSLELSDAWVNEAREVPKGVIDALTGRVGRYPPLLLGGAAETGIIMDTNAPDTDHWWYRLAEEKQPPGWEFFAQPPGDSPDAENRGNLPPGYYDRIIAGKDADWIKVYVRGEYGFVRDGKPVIPEYADAVHCREVEPVPGRTLTLGIDFGLTPAAVIAQRQPSGRIVWLDELVAEDMGALRFGQELARKLQRDYPGFTYEAFGDPAGEARAQTDERTPFQMLAAAGIQAVPACSNDPMLRREAIASPLLTLVDGLPGLLISPNCRIARKGLLGGYCYRRVRLADVERFYDTPDKNRYSHVLDAAGYAMLGLGEGRALIRRGRSGPHAFAAQTEWNAHG
jgi:hypothetical protein